MTDAVSAATAAMLMDLERLRAAGQNFANSGTVGYKAEYALSPAIQERFAQVLAGGDPAALMQAALDERPGTLRQTGRKLDLAVDGPGYFEVETPHGIRYTRRGDFNLGADGLLQTTDGHSVMGMQGVVRLSSDDLRIDRDGAMHQGEQLIGHLTVSVFERAGDLVHEGNGLYRSNAAPAPASDGSVTIRQGYLEASNVQPVAEMVRLMETVRHFGLTAQALRAHDEILESSINRLGEF